jgi:hypothetical protein
MYAAGTVYGFIACDTESARLMREEFRPTISSDGFESWTTEQVLTLAQTLPSNLKLEIVK